MKRPSELGLALTLLCGCTQQPFRQPVSLPPPVPAPAPMPVHAPAPPAVIHPPGFICDQQPRDGETLYRIQTAVNRLMPRLQADSAYGGAWYEHAPCYRIVFAFKDGQPRQWVIDAADPELRPFIAFGTARYSESERDQARREIGAALAAAGVRSAFMVSIRPEQFTVTVPTQADAQIASWVIPTRHRAVTRIAVGPIEPVPER